jgi:hypothetical protein
VFQRHKKELARAAAADNIRRVAPAAACPALPGEGATYESDEIPNQRSLFALHMIATDSRGNIYTGEVDTGKLIQKVSLQP